MGNLYIIYVFINNILLFIHKLNNNLFNLKIENKFESEIKIIKAVNYFCFIV